MMMSKCGCYHGLDCTKISVCSSETVIEELQYRIEDLESQVAELQAQVDEKYLMDEYWKLQAQVDGVIEILENTEELNPSNYDHELVCQMNNSFVEMWNFLHPKAAIKGDTNDND